ncbi:autotransporter outer membrane beta-barrel domain-containing protein [Escherichia coli]
MALTGSFTLPGQFRNRLLILNPHQLPLSLPIVNPNPTPEPDPTPNPTPTPKPTTTADAGGNYLNVGYLNYVENRTLMQRMGDLRNQSKDGNIWLRSYGGSLDSFASGKLSGFDMGYSGIQLVGINVSLM